MMLEKTSQIDQHTEEKYTWPIVKKDFIVCKKNALG